MSNNSSAIVADAALPAIGFSQVPLAQKIKAGLGVVALLAVATSAWLWSQQPDWRVLYTSLSDKDGGAVIASLAQMNLPYKFTEGGGAIMVPANRVHDARLKLASQGLPRGGNVGFELQVAGILHLVASSVPDMATKQVSIVDQNGSLISDFETATTGLDASQLNYLRQIEASLSRRIMDILEPIAGVGNIRAQVTADLDFTQSEATAELYKPNQTPDAAAIRSKQSVESNERAAGAANGGVPGAMTNQPPASGTAPVNGPAQATQAAAAAGAPASGATGGAAADSSARRRTLTNYEVDKTVRVTRNPTGTIKRLSVAVLVNQRQSVNAENGSVSTPLTAQEMESINALVRDAVGYSRERGDSLNVVNAAFTRAEQPPAVELALWQQPENIALAKDLGKQFGFVLLALMILMMLIRPALKAASRPATRTHQALKTASRASTTACRQHRIRTTQWA